MEPYNAEIHKLRRERSRTVLGGNDGNLGYYDKPHCSEAKVWESEIWRCFVYRNSRTQDHRIGLLSIAHAILGRQFVPEALHS